jgi:hypothetical protein
MSRLMRELADAGVKLAATSNTLPGSLGDGRFAAVADKSGMAPDHRARPCEESHSLHLHRQKEPALPGELARQGMRQQLKTGIEQVGMDLVFFSFEPRGQNHAASQAHFSSKA